MIKGLLHIAEALIVMLLFYLDLLGSRIAAVVLCTADCLVGANLYIIGLALFELASRL